MKNLILLSAAVFLIASCGSSADETVQPAQNVDSTKTDTITEAGITYEVEWDAFKKSVVDNDSVAFMLFVGPDVSEPISLLGMLQEDWVMEDLNATTYTDLINSDYNGTPVKEFSAGVEGEDEEGTVYESGIFLYFEESPAGFMLVNVLMAG